MNRKRLRQEYLTVIMGIKLLKTQAALLITKKKMLNFLKNEKNFLEH